MVAVPRSVTYSYADLVPQHRPDLVAFAIRLCRSRSQAEDVVQAALVRALEAWHSFRGGDHGPDIERTVRAWLFTIVRHVHATQCRRNHLRQAANVAKREVVVEATYGTAEDVCDPWAVQPETEYSDEVADALMGLDDTQRAVVELSTEGRSYKEISVQLHIPIGTVMSRLNRARRRLEIRLAGYARAEYGIGMPGREPGPEPLESAGDGAGADALAGEAAESEEADSDCIDAVV